MADDQSREPAMGPARPKKQAVVLIHGIGEQRPMATLWKLVKTVWSRQPRSDGKERLVYSEPDEISGIFELRRLSTNENIHQKRTDFFEFYWAHLMHGNDFGHVLKWLFKLATRDQAEVPPWLQKPYRALQAPLFLGIAVLVIFFLMFISTLGYHSLLDTLLWFAAIVVTLAVAFFFIDKLFLSPVVGDAARYLSRDPGDILRRQDIRAKGLELLESLHKSQKYDRIILVCHSLGGVIGYDLVSHMWGRRNRRMDQCKALQEALLEAEAAAADLRTRIDDETRARWRRAQRAMFDALREGDDPDWLISDFVTLGCPLTHAPILLADTRREFEEAVERREYAVNPPIVENFSGRERFSYCRDHRLCDDANASPRAPHNAAVFGVVRWTNIYFPSEGVLRGDLVGGPASGIFGPGVIDVAARSPVREKSWLPRGWLPHLRYFDTDMVAAHGKSEWADHREALVEAMALEDLEACWPGRQIAKPAPGALRA
jgi:hypothetical protein